MTSSSLKRLNETKILNTEKINLQNGEFIDILTYKQMILIKFFIWQPRIDPLKLLTCLGVLLAPNGGIRSSDEVKRLAG